MCDAFQHCYTHCARLSTVVHDDECKITAINNIHLKETVFLDCAPLCPSVNGEHQGHCCLAKPHCVAKQYLVIPSKCELYSIALKRQFVSCKINRWTEGRRGRLRILIRARFKWSAFIRYACWANRWSLQHRNLQSATTAESRSSQCVCFTFASYNCFVLQTTGKLDSMSMTAIVSYAC